MGLPGVATAASSTPWGAIAGIGGSLLSGLFGRSGQSSANRSNLRIAREQMQFQERMSNTAYQRSADDLEKAGLNRILALGKPASSPPGASAKMENTKASMAEAARTAALQFAQIKNVDASTAKAVAETELTKNKTYATDPMALMAEQLTKYLSHLKTVGSDKNSDIPGFLLNLMGQGKVHDTYNPKTNQRNLSGSGSKLKPFTEQELKNLSPRKREWIIKNRKN